MAATKDLNLDDVRTFCLVVENSSFSATGRALGVPTSTVSRRIARLEEALGSRLLQRTTRSLKLTDPGRVYHERCSRLFNELDDAARAVVESQSSPRGKIRLTTVPDLGGRVFPILAAFLAEYPDVSLDLVYSKEVVNLVKDGVDVALRAGPQPTAQSLIVRKLRETRRVLAATPGYLEAHGTPTTPSDLSKHECIVFQQWTPQSAWTLRGPRGDVQVRVDGRVATNHLETAYLAMNAGFGIAQASWDAVGREIENGELVEVLPGACPPGDALWLIYPSRDHLAPAVRALIDYLTKYLDDAFVTKMFRAVAEP